VRPAVERRATGPTAATPPVRTLAAAGHRILDEISTIPDGWPTPFVVQEFIELARPAVYRLYAAGDLVFGWNVRQFADANRRSPWVAHATGAEYSVLGAAPAEAIDVARPALQASGLWGSFGCVDLLDSPRGWLALEVGTDGMNNYVDRDVPEPLRAEIDQRIAEAFYTRTGMPVPWGDSSWSPHVDGLPRRIVVPTNGRARL
jgi:hypothetical protein